jgi:hypothetical protein
MSELQHSMPLNSRVPFDILYMIFDIYAENDGRKDPLEKLLSICKTWRAAACQHHNLWSSFRIKINIDDDVQFWHSRIPDRLTLCSDKLIDLEIRIGTAIDSSSNSGGMISEITSLLIGKDGSLVEQWRQLYLDNLPEYLHGAWNKALAYPTPNLRLLHIYGISYLGYILPFAASLEDLQIHGDRFSLVGELPKLKILHFDANVILADDIDPALSSPKLVHLEMTYCIKFIRFSFPLLNLETIHLLETPGNEFIESFSAPRLQSLCLYVRERGCISKLRNCPGINFQQLDTIGLAFRRSSFYLENEVEDILDEVKQFVPELYAVTTFKALNPIALRVILLCLQDGIHPPTKKRGCILQLDYKINDPNLVHRFVISTNSIEMDIQRIRQTLHLPVKDSWDETSRAMGFSPWLFPM